MDLAKRLGNLGVALLVLNEIRGAIFVAVLLSSGTHLFGAAVASPHLGGLAGTPAVAHRTPRNR